MPAGPPGFAMWAARPWPQRKGVQFPAQTKVFEGGSLLPPDLHRKGETLITRLLSGSLILAASVGLLATAHAGPLSGTIDLSTVGTTMSGVRFLGIGPAMSEAGISVSSIGDFNGDGIDDVLVGDKWGSPGGRYHAGESYLVYGQSGAASLSGTIELSTVGSTTPGVRFQGIDPSDESGFSVSSAGDVNGDGVDDLLIGAWWADPGGKAWAGETYLVYGQRGPAALSGTTALSTVGSTTRGARFDGRFVGNRSGRAVSSAGDFNGDGLGDLLIGATGVDFSGALSAGEAYLLYGQPEPAPLSGTISLSTVGGTTPGVRFRGSKQDMNAGVCLSSAGDINGDGVDDVVIGAKYESLSISGAGEAFLVYGQPSAAALSGTVDLSSVGDTVSGVCFTGISCKTLIDITFSVSSPGDVDGDGLDDLLIGSTGASPCGNSAAGETYLVYGQRGPAALSGTIEVSTVGSTTPGARFEGAQELDRSGGSVSSAGDVDGDGLADLLIGAPTASRSRRIGGETYLIYGQDGPTALSGIIDLSTVGDAVPGARFEGIEEWNCSGYALSLADFNGDGLDDLLIGAPNPGVGGRVGETYLIYGQPVPEPGTFVLTVLALLPLLAYARRRHRQA